MNEPISANDVREALLSFAEEEFGWDSFSEYTNYYDHKPGTTFDVPGLGTVTLVDFHDYDQDKSYDGWEEGVWQVWAVNGVLYRIKGTHTSYTGTEWEDEMTLVRPKQKVIIEYEDVS